MKGINPHRWALLTKTSVLFAAVILFAGTAYANCAYDPDCPLVWSDEFDGPSLDLSKWEYMFGNGQAYGLAGWGNNELQYYTNANDTVSGGFLTITAKNDGFAGYDYTSTRIRTLGMGDWTYGRVEMRAQLPIGQGMWPAFWMLPTDPSIYGVWAASGEIDIMESTGDFPERILGTLHYGGSFPANVFSGNEFILPAGTAHTQFHTYAVEWQEGVIRWYIDDVLYGIQNDWYSTGGPFPAPFDVDFHLLLNLAVGGNLPGNPDGSTVFPMDYVIDYVRVYSLPPVSPPASLVVFDDFEHGDPVNVGWFAFGSAIGGGGIDPNGADLAPIPGNGVGMQTGWGSGGVPGFLGGFGWENPLDISGTSAFSMWINPDPGQDYVLEINIQDDDNGDGVINSGPDDEFQYNCAISASGPCAIAGGGWQKIVMPLSEFFDDNSAVSGGNGILDAQAVANGGNGEMITMVAVVVTNSGADVTFRTDQWQFESPVSDTDGDGISDATDNCLEVINPAQTDSNGDGFGNLCDPDLDNNGIVNFLDVGIWDDAFLATPADGNWNADADFDSNGAVNFLDFAKFSSYFLQPPGPSGVAP